MDDIEENKKEERKRERKEEEKNTSKNKLSQDEKKEIGKDVYALSLRRVGGVVLSSTDNIVINQFISLGLVGIYSNYTLIVTSIQTITTQLFSSTTASLGNFVAENNNSDDVEKLFRTYTFSTYLVYGIASIFLLSLTNRFIELLWGADYLLSKYAVFLIVFNFFLYGFQSAINVFRDTTGLFRQGKYRSLISAGINVASSIVLVLFMGIEGVILGTIISRLLVSSWYDPYVIYKHFFKKSVTRYFIRLGIYILLTFAVGLLVYYIQTLFDPTILNFVFVFLISFASSFFLLLPFFKTEELNDLVGRLKSFIKRIFNNHQKNVKNEN